MMTRTGLFIAAALAAIGLVSAASAVELPANDYPTAARADYVFACMQVNGQTRDSLDKCSCSIDAVAAVLPYAQYEAAQTIISVAQRPGDNAELFRSYQPYIEQIKNLRRAQVEGELRCF
jgi:hypothetical protein